MPIVAAGRRRDPRQADTKTTQDPVLEADIESFPASDPPGWIPARIGPASAVDAGRQKIRHGAQASKEIEHQLILPSSKAIAPTVLVDSAARLIGRQ